jgi:DNA-binding IclR family transcriptional regulator
MIVQPRASAPALERGIHLLSLLAGADEGGVRAAELQKRARTPPASFFRILKTLAGHGLIAQNAHTGLYHLGPLAMVLGFQARVRSPLVGAATAVLRELAGSVHHMTELAAAIGEWQLMMLETWQAERSSLRILSRPGLLFPLNHLTAIGICCLTFDETFSLKRYEELARRAGGRQRLSIAQGIPSGLAADCERFRKLGYCWRAQSVGNTRICAPVFDPARPRQLLGVLSVVCESREFSLLRAAQWAPLLKSGAEKIIRNLKQMRVK